LVGEKQSQLYRSALRAQRTAITNLKKQSQFVLVKIDVKFYLKGAYEVIYVSGQQNTKPIASLRPEIRISKLEIRNKRHLKKQSQFSK
jgi:hypothetical protein